MASQANDSSSWPATAIAGTWHLLDQAADETDIPDHRMDLRFDHGLAPLRAAVLPRVTGEEMLLIHGASFDGEVLRLQMFAPPGKNQAEMPFLVMKVAGMKLLGHWQQRGVAMGPGLKLVRAQASNPPLQRTSGGPVGESEHRVRRSRLSGRALGGPIERASSISECIIVELNPGNRP